MNAQSRAYDATVRSPTSVVLSLLVAAGICLLPGIPAIRSVLRVDVRDVVIAMSGFAVVMIAGAVIAPRYPRSSRMFDVFDTVETFLIEGVVLSLVYASGRGDSFFWVLWITHAMIVGNAGTKLRTSLVAFLVMPALTALAFLVGRGDGGSAVLSLVIGALGGYVLWLSGSAAQRLAAVDADRARLATELADAKVLQERQRIARDIHDGLGSDLAALDWRLRSLRADAGIAHEVDALVARLGHGASELRAIVWALRTPERTWSEVVTYLTQRATELCGDRLVLTLVTDGDAALARPGEQSVEFLRAVLELVHNAVRHAEATQLAVTVRATPTALAATVEDDGRGIPAEVLTREEGGLANLRSRIARSAGALAVTGRAPRGTRIDLSFPLAPVARA